MATFSVDCANHQHEHIIRQGMLAEENKEDCRTAGFLCLCLAYIGVE